MKRLALRPRLARLVPLAVLVIAAGACGGGGKSSGSTTTGGALVGLFKVDPGVRSAGAVTSGSYFRMIQTGGNPGSGPYVPNGDSSCKDKTWSAMLPGAAGGFRTDAYQPNPTPAFDAKGNGAARDIVQPVTWFAVSFAISTNATDPQTKTATTKPTVTRNGSTLTADLRAFAASWNGVFFNQGAPKPDGAKPGNTSGPTGTYDATTKHYTLDWTSQIVGGSFNNFTGVWHLEGTFVPAG